MDHTSLAEDIFSGKSQLWLILEGDEFLSFVLTEIKGDAGLGHKSVLLTGLAGEAGIDICPLIGKIEEWAWSIGADEVCPVGRLGWKKGLARWVFGRHHFLSGAAAMNKTTKRIETSRPHGMLPLFSQSAQ